MLSLKPDIIHLFKLKEKYQGWEKFYQFIIYVTGQTHHLWIIISQCWTLT
jgi:hypothetical protein